MINVDILESQWKNIRSAVRLRWKALTDDDVELIDGHFDVLVDLLQEKYSYSRQLAEEEVRRFVQEIGEGQAK